MLAVLSGFTTILVVMSVGWCAGRWGLLRDEGQLALSNLAFSVATPCLMFLLVWRMDLRQGLAGHVGVSVAAAVLAACAYLLLKGRRAGIGENVIGMFCAGYVNAANLGLPIAAFVLGDMTWMAPILLAQTVVLQPIGVTVLDVLEARRAGRGSSILGRLLLPVRNPITIGALAGLLANLCRLHLPQALVAPIEMLGQLSIPGMLVAFGVSLHLHGRLRPGPEWPTMWILVAIKLVLMPVLAYVLARAAGLDPAATRACTVIACLPTAQNVFVIAQRYQRAVGLARDTILTDTILSIPVLFTVASLLSR